MRQRRKSKKTKRKKLSLRKAARRISQLIYKYLVEEPEKEREENIAALERVVAKRFRRHPIRKRTKK